LIVAWCGQFLIFVVLHQFSQVVGEWLENQILIPDWTYFYCPGTTLVICTMQGLPQRIFVTGGSGFVGRHLISELLGHHSAHDVVALVRSQPLSPCPQKPLFLKRTGIQLRAGSRNG